MLKCLFTLRIVWTCWFKDSFRSAILAGIKFDNDWAGGLIFEEFLRALSDISVTKSWWQGSHFVTNIDLAVVTLFITQNHSWQWNSSFLVEIFSFIIFFRTLSVALEWIFLKFLTIFRLGIFEWLGMMKHYLILVSNQFGLRNLVTRSEVNESRVLLRL